MTDNSPATAADATILYGKEGVAAMASDTGGVGTTPPTPQTQTEGGTPSLAPSPAVESAPVVPPTQDSTASLIPPAATAAKDGKDPASGGAEPTPPKEGEQEAAGKTATPEPLTVDSYKDLKVPDGLTLDPEALTEFKKMAAETGITPDKAPAVLDLYKDQLTKQYESYMAQTAEQNRKWAQELDSIPEFKGERRAAAQATIGKALDQFGSPEVRELIQSYGLSNNPHLGLFIYKLAEGLQEGRMLSGGQPTSRDNSGKARGQSPGSILYPNHTQ